MEERREEREKIFSEYLILIKKLKSRVDQLEAKSKYTCPICLKETNFTGIVCLAKCGHTACIDCATVLGPHCHICRTNCSRSDKIKLYL